MAVGCKIPVVTLVKGGNLENLQKTLGVHVQEPTAKLTHFRWRHLPSCHAFPAHELINKNFLSGS